MQPPAVTFAIPCRNGRRHLRALLESLLAQTRHDFDLLLVDDASSDGSVELARAVAGDRIAIHRNDRPLGIGGNWNRCIELAATPFVCLAHQDDVYGRDYAARMVAALAARPDAGMAHCRARAMDADGRPLASPAERYKDHFWREDPGTDRAAHYHRLFRGNFVVCPSMMFRTAAVRAAGGFRTDLHFALDWEFAFRLLRAGFGIVDVPEALVRYRRHAAAATAAANSYGSRFAEELRVLGDAVPAGQAAGLLPQRVGISPALRNNLLHEALADLHARRFDGVRRKLAFVREHAPDLWRDPLVRAFRLAWRLGPPGRWLLTAGRELATRTGLWGGAPAAVDPMPVVATAPLAAAAPPRVAVVVLNWDGLLLTRACVRSLLRQSWPACEIHVVDNGSRGDDAGALRAEFGTAIRVHELPRNEGFAGGCNAALRAVLAEGCCEFVALLNNDAEADPRWLEELVATAVRDARTGAVASRMRLYDQPDLLDNAGVWLLRNGECAPRGRLQPAADWNRPDEVLVACGGAVLLRTAMLRAIGVFRDDFVANFEDVDLLLRAQALGWRVRYAPAAEVRHHLNATIRRVRDAEFDARSVRNATWACFVNLPWPVLLLGLPGFLLSNLAILCLTPLLGRPAVALAFLRGRWRALRELPTMLAERRRLAPLRRGSWWRIWCAQRSFIVEYARLLWLQCTGRRAGVMEHAPRPAR